MAIGGAQMFNVVFPPNFDAPYRAANIRDFWRRWHMTLSSFLKHHVYIPLGGSRFGPERTSAAIMATFLLGGLWHGAGWTFLFWGLLNGIGVIVHDAWRRTPFRMPQVLAWLLTFLFVNVGWVFFRAHSVFDALAILRAMAGWNGLVLPASLARFAPLPFIESGPSFSMALSHINGSIHTYLWLVTGFALAFFVKAIDGTARPMTPTWRSAALAAVLAAYTVLSLRHSAQFLYFRF